MKDEAVLVLYDVSDLLEGPKDFGPDKAESFRPVKLIEAYIQKLAAKDAKLSFELHDSRIALTATPTTHNDVDQFISRLRHASNLQVFTSFRIVEAASAEGLQAVLTAHGVKADEQGIAFVDSQKSLEISSDKGVTLISAPRLTTLNNQRAYVEVSHKDPNTPTDEFVDGLRISTRNIVSADQRFVTMEVNVLIKNPPERFASKTTLTLSDGATAVVLLKAEKKSGKSYALVCSATILEF